MSLLDFQRVFSRVLVDADFRYEFFCSPERASGGYNLSAKELRSLCELDKSRVALHARNLLAGRVRLALKALPLTREFVVPYIALLAERYARFAVPKPSEGSPARREALLFCDFLLSFTDAEIAFPLFLKELVRFDRTVLSLVYSPDAVTDANSAVSVREAFDPDSSAIFVVGRHVAALSFGFNLSEILSLASPSRVPPMPAPFQLLVIRRPTVADVRVIAVSDSVLDLLALFDGKRSCRDVIAKISSNQTNVQKALNAVSNLQGLSVFAGVVRPSGRIN
jgi:hypothetical protein